MSNQYKSALHYASEELQTDLNKYGIKVDLAERMVVFRELAIPIRYGTTKVECRRILKKTIKAAQNIEIKENQESLL